MNYYCYKITHTPTGRYYIGQRKLPKRFSDWTQDKYFGSGSAWKKIYNVHPPQEFVKECLAQFDSKEKTDWAELMLVGELWQCDPLCKNLKPGGEGGNAPGMNLGRKLPPPSDETKAKISAANKGRKRSDESKAKMSAALKGKPKSAEHKAKMSESQKGRSAHNKGIPFSDEAKAKMSAAKMGKPKSAEHKANISAARKTYWAKRKDSTLPPHIVTTDIVVTE